MVRRYVVLIVMLGWADVGIAQPASAGDKAEGSPAAAPAGAAGPAATPPAVDPTVNADTGRAPPPRVLPGPPSPSARPDAGRPAPAQASSRWVPFGYLRVQAALVQNDPNVAFVGRADGFELQNARLGVRGRLNSRAAFAVSFDGAVDEREKVNVPNGRLRVGLRDAFAELALTPSLRLLAGRFEIWFDPDGKDADTERGFVDRALESRGVRATEGWQTDGLPPGRSIGVSLRWRSDAGEDAADDVADGAAPAAPPAWAVELAAQNGADEFASNNDNDSPALSAAVRAQSSRGWAQLAARWNQRTEGALPFRQDETDLEGALAAGGSFGPVSAAAGAALVRTSFPTTGGPAQRAWGAHGQALVRLPGSIPLAAGYRFAILDPSSLVLTDRMMEHTIGAVLALPALRARLQLNLTHAVEQAARALSNDRLEAALEVSL